MNMEVERLRQEKIAAESRQKEEEEYRKEAERRQKEAEQAHELALAEITALRAQVTAGCSSSRSSTPA